MELCIYRKPTYIDITIHFSSNHPYGHKLAALHYYINRILIMPISEQVRKQEWNRILTMARNNGFPAQLLHGMKKQIIAKKKKHKQGRTNNTAGSGSLSLFTAPQYIKSPTYSRKPT